MRSTARRSSSLRIWLVFLLATVPAAGAAAGNGPCFSVSVSDPVVLPGTDEARTGELTICTAHELSPVSTIHKAYFNGRHVAMLASTDAVGEASGEGEAQLMFNKDALGRLHLYGLAALEDGRMTSYRLHSGAHFGRRNRPKVKTTTTFAHAGDVGTVLLVARDSRTVGR